MSTHSDQPAWRALTVKSRHEKSVAQNLRGRGVEEFLPLYASKRAWSDRSVIVDMPLFPGYVFCRFQEAERMRVLSTPGVAAIVGFGGRDAVVDDEQLLSVQRMLASGVPIQPWPYVQPGHIVEIHAGPLSGLRGEVVREKGLWRLIVNVQLLHRSVAAELGREMVQSVAALREGCVAAA